MLRKERPSNTALLGAFYVSQNYCNPNVALPTFVTRYTLSHDNHNYESYKCRVGAHQSCFAGATLERELWSPGGGTKARYAPHSPNHLYSPLTVLLLHSYRRAFELNLTVDCLWGAELPQLHQPSMKNVLIVFFVKVQH